jgi:hypothetical protein
MGSVLDLISQALFIDGILGADQVPSPEDANVCFTSLNGIVDTWNTARENLFLVGWSYITLLNGTQIYNTGPTTVYPRFLVIQNASAFVGGLDLPMDLLSSDEWAAIEDLNATSIRPLKLYYDYGFPNASVYVWPLPVVPGATAVKVYAQQALSPYVTLTDIVSLPSGYYEALLYNLAVRIAPIFGAPIDPTVVQMAIDRKRDMQRLNENFLRSVNRSDVLGGVPTVGIPQPLPPGAPPQ